MELDSHSTSTSNTSTTKKAILIKSLLKTSCLKNRNINNESIRKNNRLGQIETCYQQNIDKNNDTKIQTIYLVDNDTTEAKNSNFKNDQDVSLNKQRASMLPPCRICGAKASGFHYGVNSCEACKGFFRRALKRPMTFYCMKNKKCDVNGNRRSNCRFCRYKRCLRLGMSMESIKTGRYSHVKRTMDTVEVKSLQNSPSLLMNEFEMDSLIDRLISVDNSCLMSTTNIPNDIIYMRQLKYHNDYILRKKFGHYSGFTLNNSSDTSTNFDGHLKNCDIRENNDDYPEFKKLSNSSISSPQLSPDSGYVDELDVIMDRTKSGLSVNEENETNEDLHELIDVDNQQDKIGNNVFLDVLQHNGTSLPNNCHTRNINLSKMDNIKNMLYTHELTNSNLGFSGKADSLKCSQSTNSARKIYYRNIDNSFEKSNNISHPHEDYTSKTSSNDNILCDRVKHNYLDSNNNYPVQRTPVEIFSNKEKITEENSYNCSTTNSTSRQCTTSYPEIRGILNLQKSDELANKSNFQKRANLSEMYSFRNDRCVDMSKPSGNETWQNSGIRLKSAKYSGYNDHIDSCNRSSLKTEVPTNYFSEDNYNEIKHRETKETVIRRVRSWIQGYIDFAKAIPDFDSLDSRDKSALLKHAWDEVWILCTYGGYNSDLNVVMAPCGKCVHRDEMDKAWGTRYSRIAFNVADIINKHNVTPGLISLFKAVCIVTPDRCQLHDSSKIAGIQWMLISCILRYIKVTHTENHAIFPRLISILVSLRELSESAQRNMNRELLKGGLDCDVFDELANYF